MNEKCTAVVRRSTYEVLSASTEAYSFIGQRFYHPFDHLVSPEDRADFAALVAVCAGTWFPLRLLDAKEQPVLYLVSAEASANPQDAVLQFVPAVAMMPRLEHAEQMLEMKNKILSIYNDEYFDYHAGEDVMRIYRVGKYEQVIAKVTLEQFFDRMASRICPEDKNALEQFCAEFRSGQTTLLLKAEGNLMDERDAALTLIKGQSLYERGQYTGAVGVIHYGARRGANALNEHDSLTGLLSKAEITGAAINMIDVQKAPNTTVAIVDVDHFKQVNDTFGHMTGDTVLKRIASILVDEVGSNGLVGRIGGDEFMVIYLNVGNMENNRELLRSIKNRVAAVYPEEDDSQPTVTLSIGCAAYPKDAGCYEDVFRLADFAMYRAKHNGRNRYVIFDQAKHGTLAEILKSTMTTKRINRRGDMSVGDIMCSIAARVFDGGNDSVYKLMEESAIDLGFQRITLYAGCPWHVVCTVGAQRLDETTLRETIGYLDSPELLARYEQNGVLVCDDIERYAAQDLAVYAPMKRQGILSCIHLKGVDAAGQRFVMSIESVGRRVTWDPRLVKYYALFRRILHEFTLP